MESMTRCNRAAYIYVLLDSSWWRW